MTPSQISERANDLRKELVTLSAVQIGMSNYKDMMRRYQKILLDLITCVRELSEFVDTLSSTDQRNTDKESL